METEAFKACMKSWKKGLARIWTAIAGFRVQSANRYTTRPCFEATFFNIKPTNVIGIDVCLIEDTAVFACCNYTSVKVCSAGEMLRLLRLTRVSMAFWSRSIHHIICIKNLTEMDTLGIEPRASRMLSGCDTTTPCAQCKSAFPSILFVNKCRWNSRMLFVCKQSDRLTEEMEKWSHAGLNRGPYGYWPYALANWAMRPWHKFHLANVTVKHKLWLWPFHMLGQNRQRGIAGLARIKEFLVVK